jgi:hypothetical protein
MPTETITTNERLAPEALPQVVRAHDEKLLRELAVKHLEHVRKLKLYAAAYVLGLFVLTPVWLVTEYMRADGWPERFSDQANTGDWNPWILWVALVGGFLVGVAALRAYFGRPVTEADIEQEVERLKSSR